MVVWGSGTIRLRQALANHDLDNAGSAFPSTRVLAVWRPAIPCWRGLFWRLILFNSFVHLLWWIHESAENAKSLFFSDGRGNCMLIPYIFLYVLVSFYIFSLFATFPFFSSVGRVRMLACVRAQAEQD